MSFAHPLLFAVGGACVAIPILIHLLLRFRRRPVRWGAMRFLILAYKRQRKWLRLQQFLLLAARCLVILLAAAAIARPLVGGQGVGAGEPRTLHLLIDNGIAAQLRDEGSESTALDRHKGAARALIDRLRPGDRVAIHAMGEPAESVTAQPTADLDSARSLVDRVEPTDAPTDLAGALRRAGASIERETERAVVALLSDFYTGSADASRPLGDLPGSLAGATFAASAPGEGERGNTQVVSVEPLRAVLLEGGDEALVRVGLRRTGAAVRGSGVSTVRVWATEPGGDASGPPDGQSVVRWSEGQETAEATVRLSLAQADGPTRRRILLATIDRDALPADNERRRPIVAASALRVGVAARRGLSGAASLERLSAAEWLMLALRPGDASPVNVLELDPGALDAPSLSGLDALMLPRPDQVPDEAWELLERFVRRGGLLVVFPPAELPVHTWSDALTGALRLDWRLAREPEALDPALGLAAEQPSEGLFGLLSGELEELTRPVRVERTLPVEQAGSRTSTLLTLEDGSPWLIASSPGPVSDESDDEARGLVVYMASAPTLTWTNTPAMPLMVPLTQEVARQGVGRAAGEDAVVAGRRPVAPPGATALVLGGDERISVDERGVASRPVRRAGVAVALGARSQPVGALAINPAVDGALLGAQRREAIERWLSEGVGGLDEGVRWIDAQGAALEGERDGAIETASESGWALPLLAAALALAVIETLLARLFSHASRAETEGAPA